MLSEKVIETLDRLGVEISSDELAHYGVVGMKWGVKRNSSKAFGKAGKSIDRMKKRSSIHQLRGLNKTARAVRRRNIDVKTMRAGVKLQQRGARLNARAIRLERQMAKVFKDVKVSDISSEDLSRGKSYVQYLLGE